MSTYKKLLIYTSGFLKGVKANKKANSGVKNAKEELDKFILNNTKNS